ncbi:hypothetical protein CLUG_02090 [Clavispora lusitaniae ATCC 42720]|uniref:Metallo-beta-lactamase domain-containing protein n=1 Tax=Clavispora lusitaniae (strain ATCC 42720) TaxID=306902 RepID=C4Y1K8_CLAL4|nr:uncharacterized protein CLUG_02090 [Clavispora lusitaniae ATCC 42720]EEQ37967.1 hypothetical protein CLUG_02090 [Clavispora lusitaniae ATCC 42720]
MGFLPRLSLKAKIGLGILVSYTSFELHMHYQTVALIKQRQAQMQVHDDLDIAKYKSAMVSGMFVNPFQEYRPQTAFEFLTVRIAELFESFYANKIEIHDKYPTPEGDFASVDHLLKTFRPNYELMRKNSTLLAQCVAANDFSGLYKKLNFTSAVGNQMLFTWLGQSCSLVQISGINILTDPMFGDHLIDQKFGPKRLVKSPMTLEEVRYATGGKLDFVFVSHNHPDHLDLQAAKEIGNSAMWIVPLGLKSTLARKGIYNVVEMDWWEKLSLNPFIAEGNKNFPDNYEIVCVPAMHWSGRHIVDCNTSLWGSFILQKNGQSVLYHAGDTGYVKGLFEAIGKKYGPVTLSLLPIGQYCPSWHQKPRHISPEESLQIAAATNSKYVFGVHFGTFKLSSEPILEPKNKLLDLAKAQGKSQFYKVPEFGLTYSYHLDDGSHHPHIHTAKKEDKV